MSNPAIKWAAEHPVPTGIGVVVVGLIILWALGAFKGGGGASTVATGDTGSAAFFAAQAAQAQANDQVQLAQIVTGAATAQAGIASTTSITNNTTWANTQEQEAENDNQSELNLGELALDKQLNQQVSDNGQNQALLNVLNLGGLQAYEAGVSSGIYASH